MYLDLDLHANKPERFSPLKLKCSYCSLDNASLPTDAVRGCLLGQLLNHNLTYTVHLRVRSSSRTTNAQTMTRPGEYLQTSDPGLRRKQWMIIVFSRSSLSRSTEVSVGLMVSPPPSPLLPPLWLLKSLSFGMTWLALEAVSHRTACHCKPQSTISSFEYSLDFLLKKPIWRCRKHRYKYRNCCCNSSYSVLLRSSGQLG